MHCWVLLHLSIVVAQKGNHLTSMNMMSNFMLIPFQGETDSEDCETESDKEVGF